MEHGKQQLWHDAASDLRTKLFRFAGRNRFNEDFDDAFSFFFGESPEEAPADYAQITLNRFTEWFVYDYRLDHGHRLVELFELEYAAQLSELMRQLLTQWQRSHLSLMEIVAIGRETITVEDLIVGGEYTIAAPATARTVGLEERSLLIGRLLRVGDLYEAPAGVTFLPGSLRESIIGWIRGEYRRYNWVRNGDWKDFLCENAYILNDLIENLSEDMDLGAPKQFCVRAVYGMVDYAACVKALMLEEESIKAVGPPSHHSSQMQVTTLPNVVGELRLSPTRLDVICPTWDSLTAAKKVVSKKLGKAVRHRVDVFERVKRDQRKTEIVPNAWTWANAEAPVQFRTGHDAFADVSAATSDPADTGARQPAYEYDQDGIKREVARGNICLIDRKPTYLSERQTVIGNIAAQVLGGITTHSAHVDAVRWIWSDYCHLANPRIHQEESWAAALHVVVGRIEGWQIQISTVADLYDCNPQTVGKKVGLIWDALHIKQFDDRYCVEHPVDSLFKHLGTPMVPEYLEPSGQAEEILPADMNMQPSERFPLYEKLVLLRDLLDNYADHLDSLVERAVTLFQRSVGQDIIDSFWHQCFTDWFHFDWAIPVRGGLTILEEAAASEELGEYSEDLQAWCGCHPSFYVIKDILPLEDLYAVELVLTPLVGEGGYLTVVWPTPTDSLQVGSILFGRLVPIDDVLISVGCALLYKAGLGEEIKERLQEEYALLGRWNGEHLSWEELSAKYADRLYGLAYRAARGFPDEE